MSNEIIKKKNPWITFVIIHVAFMGVWGALSDIPINNGFPETMVYVVWAIMMIPAAIIALKLSHWKLDTSRNAVLYGCLAGLLGAGGQLFLFFTLKIAPAYLVFPLLSLTPVVTILLAALFLHERTGRLGWIGVIIAIIAIFLLSYTPPEQVEGRGYLWILLAAVPLLAWGIQGFVLRFANETVSAESIFFYMALSAVVLIPVALLMTDFSKHINWGLNGPYATAVIQILNAFGALCLVYAFRYGKAIIVAPMTTALSPVLTVIISLIIYAVIPNPIIIGGMVLAITAAFLMGIAETKSEGK